jgi:phage head maturation protease
MLSLSEAKPSMAKKVHGWVEVMVRACLEAMGEFEEHEGGGLDSWLTEDVRLLFVLMQPIYYMFI